MSRYPEAARGAIIKCIDCNAPVVETVDDAYICVECGDSPIRSNGKRAEDRPRGDDERDGEHRNHGFGKEMAEFPAD